MTSLTVTLLKNHSRFDSDETGKTGKSVMFDSSSEQRVTRYSMPSMTVTISYRGLSNADYEELRTAYESNYANTFICDLNSKMDLREDTIGTNGQVWIFTDFRFNKYPAGCINGQITIMTSVLFNYSQYQNLMSETSTNTVSESSDTTFKTLLTTTSPNSVTYGYKVNSGRSNIGLSARLNKDFQGLRRTYTLTWLTQETEFLALLQYYRRKSGIMGEFGMPDFDINSNTLINSRFSSDSMQYVKRLDGLYETELTIEEVKD